MTLIYLWAMKRSIPEYPSGLLSMTSTALISLLSILPLWSILKENLLKSIVQCYLCGQPVQAFDKLDY